MGFGRTGERSEKVPRTVPPRFEFWSTRSRRERLSQYSTSTCGYSSRPASAGTKGAAISRRQTGPSSRPWRGQAMRSVQGVRMAPMKISPASCAGGRSMAISPVRISSRRTMPGLQSVATITSEAFTTA